MDIVLKNAKACEYLSTALNLGKLANCQCKEMQIWDGLL